MISRKKWDKYKTAIGNTREKITLKRNTVFKKGNSSIMYHDVLKSKEKKKLWNNSDNKLNFFETKKDCKY